MMWSHLICRHLLGSSALFLHSTSTSSLSLWCLLDFSILQSSVRLHCLLKTANSSLWHSQIQTLLLNQCYRLDCHFRIYLSLRFWTQNTSSSVISWLFVVLWARWNLLDCHLLLILSVAPNPLLCVSHSVFILNFGLSRLFSCSQSDKMVINWYIIDKEWSCILSLNHWAKINSIQRLLIASLLVFDESCKRPGAHWQIVLWLI